MPEPAFHDHVLTGRLLAALWTVRLLGGGGGTPPDGEEFLAKKVPAHLVSGGLRSLTDHLMAARGRGDGRWEAAVEVYREIADLLPKKLWNDTMSPGEQKAFAGGYTEQRAAHAEKYGKLLER
ncbi:hypothetical protein [Streptomyces similanensis]|uniref:Uncharacterized protein n=1 Tax=Streptomyces similanensis TaxID=1274988 RepID=A0ABP9KA44_9ACTN|nr:hypothetical protein HUT11_17095 [Streptomyces seoulensis]